MIKTNEGLEDDPVLQTVRSSRKEVLEKIQQGASPDSESVAVSCIGYEVLGEDVPGELKGWVIGDSNRYFNVAAKFLTEGYETYTELQQEAEGELSTISERTREFMVRGFRQGLEEAKAAVLVERLKLLESLISRALEGKDFHVFARLQEGVPLGSGFLAKGDLRALLETSNIQALFNGLSPELQAQLSNLNDLAARL